MAARALTLLTLLFTASTAFAAWVTVPEDYRRLTYVEYAPVSSGEITIVSAGSELWDESSNVKGNSSQDSFLGLAGSTSSPLAPGQRMLYGSGGGSAGPNSPDHGYVYSIYEGIFNIAKNPSDPTTFDAVLRGTLYCSEAYGLYGGASLHLYRLVDTDVEELVYSKECDASGAVDFSTNLTLGTSFQGFYRIYVSAWGGYDLYENFGTSFAHSYEFEMIAAPIAAEIDVLPGDAANKIYPNKGGKFPVAVLSGPAFDATQVDPASIKFGLGEAAPADPPVIADVDGLHGNDSTMNFRTGDSGILCNDTEVTMSGETYAGEGFEGTGSIDASDCIAGGCHAY